MKGFSPLKGSVPWKSTAVFPHLPRAGTQAGFTQEPAGKKSSQLSGLPGKGEIQTDGGWGEGAIMILGGKSENNTSNKI